MTIRLRLWLLAMDLANVLRLPRPIYLWCVGKASDATDWGPPLDEIEDHAREPF